MGKRIRLGGNTFIPLCILWGVGYLSAGDRDMYTPISLWYTVPTSAFAVDAMLDRHSGLVTVAIRCVQDAPPLLHTVSFCDLHSNLHSSYRAWFRNSKTGETKCVSVLPLISGEWRVSGHAPPPEEPTLRAVRLRRDEGLAGQIAFSETAVGLGPRSDIAGYDFLDVEPATLVFVVRDGKVDGDHETHERNGFSVPTNPMVENTRFTEEDGSPGFDEYIDVNDLSVMEPPVLSVDGAEVRVAIVLGRERAYLLVQAVAKDGLRLHMESVRDILGAIRMEAFDVWGEPVPLPLEPKPAVPVNGDDANNGQRSLLLRQNEAILRCCNIWELPFFTALRSKPGSEVNRVVLTPNAKVYTANNYGDPIPFAGKVYAEPLVLNRVQVLKLRRLPEDLGYQRVEPDVPAPAPVVAEKPKVAVVDTDETVAIPDSEPSLAERILAISAAAVGVFLVISLLVRARRSERAG